MSRMNGPMAAGSGPSSARDRYATSRVVTSLLFGAAAAGLTALHFRMVPSPELVGPGQVYAGAAVSAALAAWKGVAGRLGRGLPATIRSALVTAVAAGALFCLLAGVRAVLHAYAFTHFRTAEELMGHLLTEAMETGEALALSPMLVPTLVVAVVAALLGELARRAWDRVVIAPT